MWQKSKLEKPNITIKVRLEPNVAAMIKSHFEVNTIIIKVNNHMAIIQVQVGKNTIEDVLLNRRTSVNIIIKKFRTKLGLPKLGLAPYHLRMIDQSMTKPLGIIINLKIQIHGIPHVPAFTILQNNVVDSSYFMLLE
jgi:hypothetical protein